MRKPYVVPIIFLCQIVLLTGCISIKDMGPPKKGEALYTGFPSSKLSQQELFELASQELKEEGITVVESNPSEGVLLGSITPDRLRNIEGRGPALVAAALLCVPCAGCCCLNFPLGIYALVILTRADSEAAFAR